MGRCLRLPRKANRFRERLGGVGGPTPPPNQDSAHILAFIGALMDPGGVSLPNLANLANLALMDPGGVSLAKLFQTILAIFLRWNL